MSIESGPREQEEGRDPGKPYPQPFDYELPTDRIAERPCYPFHDARLLTLSRLTEEIGHSVFRDLPLQLHSGDVLVLNNTRVMKARLFGNLEETGAAVELLLVEELDAGKWRAMGRPLKKLRAGSWVTFPSDVRGQIISRCDEYHVEIHFEEGAQDRIFQAGTMPIPPYIRKGRGDAQDDADYQSAFARHEGSVAAPTAGLHFTEELLQVLRRRGVEIVEITLHVGPASFLSVWEDAPEGGAAFHPPGTENGFVDRDTVMKLQKHKLEGRRVIAVGTTVVRLLETVFRESVAEIREGNGARGRVEVSTDLFISPPFDFRMVDALITNFHQPKSSHLLLVEAFLGRSLLKRGYEAALENDYRFLSYGDGMFIE